MTEADKAKVELMITTYSRQQEKMVIQEMREFTVPELTNEARFSAPFALLWEQLWHRVTTLARREP